jgi:hypothetical protein
MPLWAKLVRDGMMLSINQVTLFLSLPRGITAVTIGATIGAPLTNLGVESFFGFLVSLFVFC